MQHHYQIATSNTGSAVGASLYTPPSDKAAVIAALKASHGEVAGPNGAANQLGLKRDFLVISYAENGH
ncbi:hypothetical protein [Photobacterium leiognathi]|uniref:hypothetical protein n=1 Tax=Photobacterium leiognathi TaxID=553611 RepID=UPI0027387989|nr:hypothetical protein [Photobacterium leiognathi]